MMNLIHIILLVLGWSSGRSGLVVASLVVALVCLVMSFVVLSKALRRKDSHREGGAVRTIWMQATVIVLSAVWLYVRNRMMIAG